MADLKPANENPWYVLATLYGEQVDGFDPKLHDKNRQAWNAWAGQKLAKEQKVEASKITGIEIAELSAWSRLKNEIEHLYQQEMIARNGENFDCPDIPSPNDTINLGQTHFPHAVAWVKCVFPADAIFSSATFCEVANFNFAVFKKRAMFSDSRFKIAANFHSTQFQGIANFMSVKFAPQTSFISASFDNKSYFNECAFGGTTVFTAASFNSEAHFDSVTFGNNAGFRSAIFSGYTYFTEAKFGDTESNKTCHPSFQDCQFEKPTSFREAVFLHNYPDLSGAVLHDKTTFTAKEENWPDTAKQMSEEKEIQENWAEASKDSCATIRHIVAKQGRPEDEHFFYRREMAFSEQIGTPLQRLPYILFRWFSDYGHSIARPAYWLLGCWLLGFAIFAGYFASIGAHDVWTALGVSFSNLFPVFGFGRLYLKEVYDSLPQPLVGFSAVQTIFSLPMLFFLGLGLRQRFRLR